MTQNLPIHIGQPVNTAQVNRIYRGIQACNLPKAEWTHGGHLCAGIAIVSEHGLTTAQALMPDIIRNYNLACDVQNTDTDGYHETITLFYLRETGRFLQTLKTTDLGERASALLASKLATQEYILNFYSKGHLFSVAARRGWQAPDIKDLPELSEKA